ncbi:MAG: helix-turn-helix transcriptional regulator [Planctomycetes bacterium]|nr:helix-turn-helix transcriptional regulator [Planctomycetota bacterium]
MATRKSKSMKLSDQLRQAIRESKHSRYAIWKATGIDQAVLSHFLAGRRGMSIQSLDLLCEFLRLELRSARRTRNGR